MKTNLLKGPLSYCLLAVFTLLSCSSNDDDASTPINENLTVAEVQSTVQSGNWKITRFVDSGEDELYHFNGYTFAFGQDGNLVATNGTLTHNGTWSIISSNSGDDDSDSDDLDFNIQFNLTNEFEDLSDDWDITSHSSNKIELMDVSGGNGGTDYLTFEKS